MQHAKNNFSLISQTINLNKYNILVQCWKNKNGILQINRILQINGILPINRILQINSPVIVTKNYWLVSGRGTVGLPQILHLLYH